MKKIILVSNDKLYFNQTKVFSEFNDTINIIEGLSQKNYIYFISRNNEIKGIFRTNLKNKFQLKFYQIKNFNMKNKKVFMISITPFNFLVFMILNFFHKNLEGFVILRSDGFKEYSVKYGFFGKKLYEFFFNKILKKLKPIVVTDKLSNIKKFKYLKIFPSEITKIWSKNLKKPNLSKPNLLYLGRIKKEKGIFSLIELIENLDIDYNLNIVGNKNKLSLTNNKIKIFKETSNKKKIINFYDQNNIFVLPSFTEGSPKVILESLSRLRPVIIFRDIKHVKSKFRGVFVINRNTKELKKTIIFILKNYEKIQLQMKKNKIPTKDQFQKDLIRIIK